MKKKLCCMVNPFAKCVDCKLLLCFDHYSECLDENVEPRPKCKYAEHTLATVDATQERR